jgi:tRNA pseudouridine-54 N-methylase
VVNFLLLIGKIIEYNKKTIDNGLTPLKIYQLCSCIREAFCLSYAIRKQNNLFLYSKKDHILISVLGKKLRYLGPDERSQAILLLKAVNIGKGISPTNYNYPKESTPGINVIRFSNDSSFLQYLDSLLESPYFLDIESGDGLLKEPEKMDSVYIRDDAFFVISSSDLNKNFNEICNHFMKQKNVKFISLTDIKPIENKILYINFIKDQQETKNRI